MTEAPPRAAILLSTFNGARFLPAQLDSLHAQTEADWVLFWRDDGSTDGTVALMTAFATKCGPSRCVRVGDEPHLGACASFFRLLAAAAPLGVPVAFADQDDVWKAEKLTWALVALAPISGPALYASRQVLVDERLGVLGESPLVRRLPSLAGALTQNVVTGCTAVLNAEAARLVAQSRPPPSTLHDWWSYLVITAAGGRVVFDDRATLLYRQHAANLIGAPSSALRRAAAALRRGPRVFMTILRDHVGALLDQPVLLTSDSRRVLERIQRGLDGRWPARLRALSLPGFRRQTAAETALFRAWFLIG